MTYETKEHTPLLHWYALRVTYGREKTASDYLQSQGVATFCPMQKVVKQIGGKRVAVMRSRLPNIFFAYGSEQQIQTYVYDNVRLPYLRFYYRQERVGGIVRREPLIVPDSQMLTFRIICDASDVDTFVSPDKIRMFEKGQTVRVVGGIFTGAVGRVARFRGQQRVGIYIDGMATVATAYVPNAFLEPITTE